VRPKFNRAYLLPAIAALVFACGVAVGQEGGRWKPGKYLAHSEATELDWKFLNMQIQEVQGTLNLLEELEVPSKAGVPTYHLDPKTGKIQVLVAVHGNWADTAPLEEVQKSLKAQAKDILLGVKFYFREISDADVEVTFAKINIGKNEIVNRFAEYKDGELAIRH
jgi:hypothetical protein